MVLRVLLRGGIYVLFVVAVGVGWLMRRSRKREPVAQPEILPVDVLTALHDSRWQVRLQAVQQWIENPDTESLPQIVALLDDPDSDVREAAVQALSKSGPEVVPLLLPKLREGTLNAREAAAHTLGKLADPTAVADLAAALNDESTWVRARTVEALAAIHTPDAAAALIAALPAEKDEAIQKSLRDALRQLGTPEALAALSRVTNPRSETL